MSPMKLVTFDAYEEFGLDYRLTQQIEFRQRTAEKYPRDAVKNEAAVDLIRSLSSQVASPLAIKTLNDAIVEYEAAAEVVEFDADAPPFESKVSASLGAIGFGWHPKNIDEVLSVLATDARLSASEVATRTAE